MFFFLANLPQIVYLNTKGTIILLVICILSYLFSSYMYYKLAKKAKYDNAWFAFIPLLDIVLIFNIANKGGWRVLLLLIPVFNIFYAIYIQFLFLSSYTNGPRIFLILLVSSIVNGILEAANVKGLPTLIITLIGLISFAYLAFAEDVEYTGTVYESNDYSF